MREPKEYTDQLTQQVEKAKAEAQEAEQSLVLIKSIKITNAAFFEEVAGIVRMALGKHKFLDEERKVSVTPLNNEVDRINAWYKPALVKLKEIAEFGKSMMATYTLEQQRKERLLLEQAQAEARRVLAEQVAAAEAAKKDGNVAGADAATIAANAAGAVQAFAQAGVATTTALVEAAASMAPPKVAGVSAPKPAWAFVIKDPAALVKARPDLAMPDEKKVKAWVAEHGDQEVPPGVEVTPDVKFTVRS